MSRAQDRKDNNTKSCSSREGPKTSPRPCPMISAELLSIVAQSTRWVYAYAHELDGTTDRSLAQEGALLHVSSSL